MSQAEFFRSEVWVNVTSSSPTTASDSSASFTSAPLASQAKRLVFSQGSNREQGPYDSWKYPLRPLTEDHCVEMFCTSRVCPSITATV
jgi:hypothetical protein